MRIIVCGAGQVGTGIARQLASEENDVIVIDSNPEAIDRINQTLDVKARVGFPSHPTVLEEVGAKDADMIIAVTLSDEINMIVCEVAHALFGVPTKIARIRNQSYLLPAWKDLYRQDHMPIDFIISPEREVAKAIVNRMHVPGALNMLPFVDGSVKVIEIRCSRTCGLIGMPLAQVREILLDLNVSIIALVREDHLVIPSKNDVLEAQDALFFVTSEKNVRAALKMFGHEEKEARRVVIVGGGNIGLFLAQYLETDYQQISVKMIEMNKERAEYVASQLGKTIVINGDALDHEILSEANIEASETVIAITNDDEVNIFASLIAKRAGSGRCITLVNKSAAYTTLVATLGIDVVVNPREITVSSILQHVRSGKVRAASSICGGQAEIIEAEAFEGSSLIGKTISALELPQGVIIGMIARGDKILVPKEDEVIMMGDRIIALSLTTQLKKVDKIFSARQDYF